jgi:hypothetical protein
MKAMVVLKKLHKILTTYANPDRKTIGTNQIPWLFEPLCSPARSAAREGSSSRS